MITVCIRCGIAKSADHFSPNHRFESGHINVCKPCRNEQARLWRINNPEKVAIAGKLKYARKRAMNPVVSRPVRVTEGGRLCSTCKTRKPIAEFGLLSSSPDGISLRCKSCTRASGVNSRYRNLDAVRAKEREEYPAMYAKNREKLLRRAGRDRLATRYGMTIEKRQEMFDAQGGLCPICDRIMQIPDGPRPKIVANIDHDHSTGKIRGLLCQSCNTGLGLFSDDTNRLAAAIRYLEHHRA